MSNLVPPILGASFLIVGTGTAIALDVRDRRRKELPHQTADDGVTGNLPLRLPTVSVATKRFLSPSYLIFVMTAFAYGLCLVWTSLLQRAESRRHPPPSALYGQLITIAALIGAPSIVLTSLVPATGRGTVPHIAFGVVFFETAILYMVWSCMLTPLVVAGNGGGGGGFGALFGVRVAIASIAVASVTVGLVFVWRTMRVEERGSERWRWAMHVSALGQMTFGLMHGLFLLTMAFG